MGDFTGGDKVRLKSGGPDMTVEMIDDIIGTVQCSWFVSTRLERADFQPEALEKVQSGSTGPRVIGPQ